MGTYQPILSFNAVLVSDIDWDITGSHLATTNGYWEHRDTTVWDVANGEVAKVIEDNLQSTTSVAWNPANNMLASVSFASITIWDVEDRQPLFTIEEYGQTASDRGSSQTLTWNPSGSFVTQIGISGRMGF
jgi:WD40 repeat protein